MNAITLIVTTLSLGLMAGLFYAWSISVTAGLAKVGDEHYLRAFQAMNRAILQPIFFVFFFGPIILLPLLVAMEYASSTLTEFWILLTAAILYMAGVMAVTVLGNIPLNNALESLKIDTMNPDQMASFRLRFERAWNNLNMIRTICSALSFILVIIACM